MGDESEFEDKLKELEEKIERQAAEIRKLKSERSTYDQAWDCYRTQDWSSNDVIEFESCDVVTVSGEPYLGILAIDAPGTYRLTFQGSIYIPPEGGAGYVRLKVNNDIIASTGTNGVYAVYPSSISVLHNLQAG